MNKNIILTLLALLTLTAQTAAGQALTPTDLPEYVKNYQMNMDGTAAGTIV